MRLYSFTLVTKQLLMTAPKNVAPVKQTGIRLPVDLYRDLRVKAAETGQGVSAIATVAIRSHLKKLEAKRAA